MRQLAVASLAVMVGIGGAAAQSGEPHPQEQKAAPGNSVEPPKEAPGKVDEYVEASQAINGPAGNPECVWLGRRVVSLMARDDLDTALRHIDLYDRFGCPGGHIQAAFRCLTRFPDMLDILNQKTPEKADANSAMKQQETLGRTVHTCWINPGAQPQPAAPPPTPANAQPAPTAAAPSK